MHSTKCTLHLMYVLIYSIECILHCTCVLIHSTMCIPYYIYVLMYSTECILHCVFQTELRVNTSLYVYVQYSLSAHTYIFICECLTHKSVHTYLYVYFNFIQTSKLLVCLKLRLKCAFILYGTQLRVHTYLYVYVWYTLQMADLFVFFVYTLKCIPVLICMWVWSTAQNACVAVNIFDHASKCE